MGYLIAEISPLVGYLFTLLDYIAHLWAQKGRYSYDSFQKYSPFVVSLWSLNGRIFLSKKTPYTKGCSGRLLVTYGTIRCPAANGILKGAIRHEGVRAFQARPEVADPL